MKNGIKMELEKKGNFHLDCGRFDRSISVPRALEELERLQPVHAQQVAVQLKWNEGTFYSVERSG